MSFEIVKINGVKSNMKYDQITKFYKDDGTIEAEYFYYNGLVNWLFAALLFLISFKLPLVKP